MQTKIQILRNFGSFKLLPALSLKLLPGDNDFWFAVYLLKFTKK